MLIQLYYKLQRLSVYIHVVTPFPAKHSISWDFMLKITHGFCGLFLSLVSDSSESLSSCSVSTWTDSPLTIRKESKSNTTS